jgi:hypothetical protein
MNSTTHSSQHAIIGRGGDIQWFETTTRGPLPANKTR